MIAIVVTREVFTEKQCRLVATVLDAQQNNDSLSLEEVTEAAGRGAWQKVNLDAFLGETERRGREGRVVPDTVVKRGAPRTSVAAVRAYANRIAIHW